MANSSGNTRPLFAGQSVKLVSVLSVMAAVAWISIYYLMMNSMQGSMDWTAGSMGVMFVALDFGTLLLFLAVWIIGMTAMMFPAMIPVVSIYDATIGKSSSRPTISSLLFLTGYLAVYMVLGLSAYLGVLVIMNLIAFVPQLSGYGVYAVGAVLIVTGVYQLTPFKNSCLKRCVSPLGFFLTHARKGLGGAVWMGAKHGYYCAACCCLYMIVMFVVAGMSLPAMAVLAIVIALEKVLLRGARWFSWLIAGGFISFGLAVLLFPNISMLM
jgi:predicted metal-binding membrane protein